MDLLFRANATPVQLVWPEALAVSICTVYLWGVITTTKEPRTAPLLFRLLSLAGFAGTAALIFLGAIWPSYYTVIALVVIPAPFMFGVAMFRPMAVWGRRKLTIYLMVCVVVAAISWAFQIYWELRG